MDFTIRPDFRQIYAFFCIDAKLDAQGFGVCYSCNQLMKCDKEQPMTKPVSMAMQAKFSSYDELARELAGGFKEQEWPSPRALSAKIGLLDKGNTGWWEKRRDQAESLAQLLGVELADLGLYNELGEHFFRFPEFPELPPLDLKQEEHCRLAEPLKLGQEWWESPEDWLSEISPGFGRLPVSRDWLFVPAGLGRDILVAELAAAKRCEVLQAATLADVGERMGKPFPMIVSVTASAEGDLKALLSRPPDLGILVIAPFDLPEGLKSEFSKKGQGREIRGWRWALKSGWRDELLRWVEERLRHHDIDSLFSAKETVDWLEQFDPREVWFRSPADVMSLCRVCHRASRSQLPVATDMAAGESLMKLLFGIEPSRCLLFKQLVNARWSDRKTPWGCALPSETWQSYVPANYTGLTPTDLDMLVNIRNPEERSKEGEKLKAKLGAGALTGLLKQTALGAYELRPDSLAGLLVRDILMRQISGEGFDALALNCFDATRRPLVDAAFEASPADTLGFVAQKLEKEKKHTAGQIAATEALFLVAGRRIAEREVVPLDALAGVVNSVLGRLDWSEALPKPWSRALTTESERLDWISACWAWSLTPKPVLELGENWLFPGWAKSLPDMPGWLDIWPSEQTDRLSVSWRRFLCIVDYWMDDLDAPIANAHQIFRFALLRGGALGRWAIKAEWWEGMLGSLSDCPWIEGELLERLIKVGNQAAARLWPSLVEFEGANNDGLYYVRSHPVRHWILEQLMTPEIIGCLGADELRHLASVPESLPSGPRSFLLQSLATQADVCDTVEFERFGCDAASSLKAWLGHVKRGQQAAECLWQWNSLLAEQYLKAESQIGDEARKNLIITCPAENLSAGIAAFLDNPCLLDAAERLSWVRKGLPDAGSEAESLLSILEMG